MEGSIVADFTRLLAMSEQIGLSDNYEHREHEHAEFTLYPDLLPRSVIEKLL